MVDPCPSEDDLLAWAHGRLPSDRRRALELHIDECDACAALLATAARDLTAAPPTRRLPARALPNRFDRYRIDARLGRGGMGVVYDAFDERLGRRVALKVLRCDRTLDVEGLRAEARALAALQHPNVVTVYEVGRLPGGDDVYIAMELVRGSDLRRVLSRGHLAQADVLALFEQAGRGLAAAHAAMLVHRDFKPDNVLVGNDGRVRVTDFGLATVHVASATSESSSSSSHATTDHVAGTPGYMAPEQLAGGAPDPRWDQYAFCVALWEALTHHRPPRSAATREVVTTLPRALRRVLVRGLADDPAARHPSMTALIAEIARARTGRPMWMLPLAAGVALAASVALASGSANEPCSAAASMTWWSEGSRPALAETTADPQLLVAREGARALAHLDRFAARISDAVLAACASGHADARTSTCLARARERGNELAALLIEDPARAVHGLDGLLRALPEPEACTDNETSTSPAVLEIHDAIAGARLSIEAGRYDEGAARTATIVARARTLGDPGALALALGEHGVALLRLGEMADGLASTREAHELATAVGDDHLAALTAYRAAFAENELVHPTAALEWIRHARAACGRIEDPALREDIEVTIAGPHVSVLLALGELDEARRVASDALQATIVRVGPDDEDLVVPLEDLAGACVAQRDWACAEGHLARALAIAESCWGEQHPRTLIVVGSLGHLDEQRDRFGDAAVWFERALRDGEAVLGATHPDVARAHYNLGVVQDRLGDDDSARREFTQALEIFPRALGDDHPVVAKTLHNLGAVALAQDDFAQAERFYARAQGIVERTLGMRDPQMIKSLLGRAEAAIGRGDGEAALGFIERADTLERELGTPIDAESLFRLARAQRTRGDTEGAHRSATAALALAREADLPMNRLIREFLAARVPP